MKKYLKYLLIIPCFIIAIVISYFLIFNKTVLNFLCGESGSVCKSGSVCTGVATILPVYLIILASPLSLIIYFLFWKLIHSNLIDKLHPATKRIRQILLISIFTILFLYASFYIGLFLIDAKITRDKFNNPQVPILITPTINSSYQPDNSDSSIYQYPVGVAKYSPAEAKILISETATKTLTSIEQKGYQTLSQTIHPTLGINLGTIIFNKQQIENVKRDPTIYSFEIGAASGFPSEETLSDFLTWLVTPTDHDGKFSTTAEVYYNEFRGTQDLNNLTLGEYGSEVIEVEYYYPGTEEYAEHDYESLQLIFLPHKNNWYLVAINRRFWTP